MGRCLSSSSKFGVEREREMLMLIRGKKKEIKRKERKKRKEKRGAGEETKRRIRKEGLGKHLPFCTFLPETSTSPLDTLCKSRDSRTNV